LLIRHSKYSTPTDCFFGDFAHWVTFLTLLYRIYSVTEPSRKKREWLKTY